MASPTTTTTGYLLLDSRAGNRETSFPVVTAVTDDHYRNEIAYTWPSIDKTHWLIRVCYHTKRQAGIRSAPMCPMRAANETDARAWLQLIATLHAQASR